MLESVKITKFIYEFVQISQSWIIGFVDQVLWKLRLIKELLCTQESQWEYLN